MFTTARSSTALRIGTTSPTRAAGAVIACVVLLAGACRSQGPAAKTATDASNASTSTSGSGSQASDGSTASTGTTRGASGAGTMQLSAAEFGDGDRIPTAHICTDQGGRNQPPTLRWTGVPDGTATLVLVMHDPDAPIAGGFTHWITTFEPHDGTYRAEPETNARPPARYLGPCPPPGGPHRYEFTLYAFGSDVSLPDNPTKADIDRVVPQTLATAKLTGIHANER